MRLAFNSSVIDPLALSINALHLKAALHSLALEKVEFWLYMAVAQSCQPMS